MVKRVGLGWMLMVTIWILLSSTAWAGGIAIALRVPVYVLIGDEVTVEAILTLGDAPLMDAEVSLWYFADLGGVEDFVLLDTAVTGPEGVARLVYQQRADENGPMKVTHIGLDGTEETFEFSIEVRGPSTQLHRSESGVSVPFINAWVLVAAIIVVWGSLVYALFQLDLISRIGREPDGRLLPPSREAGAVRMSAILLTIGFLLGSGIVVVLLRNPSTHFNLYERGEYARTPLAEVGEHSPYLGPGLAASSGDVDGAALFVGYGCAGCHRAGAGGGAVGPGLDADEFDDFARDTRRGVGEMPAYGPEVLSEDHLVELFAFLQDAPSASN